jgi:hypothetical protein
MIRIAPQIATTIPATNSQTLPLRTNAAHASAASAARARRSISLKYSTRTFIKSLLGWGRTIDMGSLRPPVTPAEILDKLHRASVCVLTSAELTAQFDRENAVPSPTTPPEFAAFVMAEQAK